MFIGHYGASFALKAARPQLPLWQLFLAVQAVDLAWALLLVMGVEKARVVPGYTEAFPVDLYYMPYTHGLLAAVIWALALGLLYRLWQAKAQRSYTAAAIIALAVASHWALDWLVHVPDLPLWGNAHKVGLGLWQHRGTALIVELLALGLGVWLCARACPQAARRLWIFAAALALLQTAHTYGPWLMTDARQLAVTAFLSYLALAYAARRVEGPVQS